MPRSIIHSLAYNSLYPLALSHARFYHFLKTHFCVRLVLQYCLKIGWLPYLPVKTQTCLDCLLYVCPMSPCLEPVKATWSLMNLLVYHYLYHLVSDHLDPSRSSRKKTISCLNQQLYCSPYYLHWALLVSCCLRLSRYCHTQHLRLCLSGSFSSTHPRFLLQRGCCSACCC